MKAFDNLAYEAKHEKPQGIQWNKYPDTKPESYGRYLCFRKRSGGSVYASFGYFEDGNWNCDDGYLLSYVTHWAEFNLPNQ